MANLQVGVAGNGTVTVGAGASVHSPASNTLTLGTNGDERLRLDSSGNLSFAGDTDTYIHHPAADQLAITKSGGSWPIIRFGSGGGGNTIAMGNTTANLVTNSEILSVRGYSSFKSNNKDYAAIFVGNEGNTAGSPNQLIMWNNGGANRGGIGYVPSTGELRFNNQYYFTFCTGASTLGGTERMRIKADGNVLIADTSDSLYNDTSGGGMNLKANGQLVLAKQATSVADPLIWLNDTGQTTNKEIVFAQDGSEKANIGLAGNDFTFATGAVERLRVRADGRVSIASSLAVAGICTAATFVPTDGQLGYRNVIVNGSMMIAQRSTSKTVSSSVAGCQTLDKWQISISGSAEYTMSQSADEPGGFMNSLKLDCTTADTSLAASDTMRIIYKGEGYDAQRFGKGTSRAVSATLSFWIKTNKTGNYQVNWRDIANGRMVGAQYTVSQANTWERKEITFPNETSNGEFYNNANQGLYLEWWFTSGSTTNSGAVPTAWEGYTAGDRAAGLNVNLADSTSNELYITGVQMEVGTVATPFEHISFENELRRCQRYYEKSYPYGTEPGTGGDNGRRGRRVCATATNQTVITNEQYQVRKRATPTVTTYSNNGASGKVMLMDYGSTTVHANSGVYGSCDYGFEVNGSGTANAIAVFWTADAEL